MSKDKQAKRNSILNAALATFVKRGFHGASMAYIAEEAGVCSCTIDDYFESKDDLIRGLCREVEARMTKKLQSSYKKDLPYKERYLTFFTGVLNYLVNNPTESRFLDQFYSSSFGVEKARHEREHPEIYKSDLFYSIINEGIEQRIIKETLGAEAACALILSPLVLVSNPRITSFIKVDNALMKEVVSATWDAVAKR
jgi:AcrR family transcriptional regulator